MGRLLGLIVLLAIGAAAPEFRPGSELVADFAGHRLGRLRERLLAESEAIEELPPHALHEVRKRAKKLRYACEFFEPPYAGKPVRRFALRLARWQDELGPERRGDRIGACLTAGADRAFAIGAVQRFLAARVALAERRDVWKRQPRFWA